MAERGSKGVPKITNVFLHIYGRAERMMVFFLNSSRHNKRQKVRNALREIEGTHSVSSIEKERERQRRQYPLS